MLADSSLVDCAPRLFWVALPIPSDVVPLSASCAYLLRAVNFASAKNLCVPPFAHQALLSVGDQTIWNDAISLVVEEEPIQTLDALPLRTSLGAVG